MLDTPIRASWLGLIALALAACSIALEPPQGTGEPGDTSQLPPQLNRHVSTGDNADDVQVTSSPDGPDGTMVRVCLALRNNVSWWKGIGLNSEDPTIDAEGSETTRCRDIQPGLVNVTFWKAKAFGAHTRLSTTSIDLGPYAGHTVFFTWLAD